MTVEVNETYLGDDEQARAYAHGALRDLARVAGPYLEQLEAALSTEVEATSTQRTNRAVEGSGSLERSNTRIPAGALGVRWILDLLERSQARPQEILEMFGHRADEAAPLNAFTFPAFDYGQHAGARPGALTGVPIGLKDVIDAERMPTTAGFRPMLVQVAERDAMCTARLKSLGAVIAGKLNTSELATFPSGENGSFGTAVNPWASDRIPGGSSSGSGVAVAAGLVAAALGCDTGGSVRVPAACCGVVGLKPTFGWLDLAGTIPLAWSLDHIGLLTRDTLDCAAVYDAFTGHFTTREAMRGANDGIAGVRVGVPSRWISDFADEPVRDQWHNVLDMLSNLGAELEEVRLPDPDVFTVVSKVIIYCEEAAWFSRHPEFRAIARSEVVTRKRIGTHIPAPDYVLALQLRQLLRHETIRMLTVGPRLIAMPTMASCVPLLRECRSNTSEGLEQMKKLVLFTSFGSLCGIPSISVPSGRDSMGMPFGLQLMAGVGDEGALLRAAAAIESLTEWSLPARLRPSGHD